MKKYNVGKITQGILNNIKYNRDLISKGLIEKFFSHHPAKEMNFMFPWLHKWLYNMRKTPDEFMVLIQKHIRFIEFDDFEQDSVCKKKNYS